MFPAVWEWDRDFYQEDFARYVDAVVADEVWRAALGPLPPRAGLPDADALRLRRPHVSGYSRLLGELRLARRRLGDADHAPPAQRPALPAPRRRHPIPRERVLSRPSPGNSGAPSRTPLVLV